MYWITKNFFKNKFALSAIEYVYMSNALEQSLSVLKGFARIILKIFMLFKQASNQQTRYTSKIP